MKKLLILLLIPILILCLSCQREAKGPEVQLDGRCFAVSIRINQSAFKAKLAVEEDGNYVLTHEDPTSPLFGLKEGVRNGNYSSEFDGIVSDDLPTPGSAGLISELLRAVSKGQGEQEAEIIDGISCVKIGLNGNFESAALWVSEETSEPVQMKGNRDGVTISVLFAQS